MPGSTLKEIPAGIEEHMRALGQNVKEFPARVTPAGRLRAISIAHRLVCAFPGCDGISVTLSAGSGRSFRAIEAAERAQNGRRDG